MTGSSTSKVARRKLAKVFHEAKEGTLRTSTGDKPSSRKQTIAIALSEAERADKKSKLHRRSVA